MPLTQIKEGRTVRLVSIESGYGLKNRLASMGVRPQTEFTVINNHHPGPFMITVKGCKMMLGRGVADKLMVLQLNSENQ